MVQDVELTAAGRLTGQIVDQQGNGLAGVQIQLLKQGEPAGQSMTATNGSFAIDNLTGGTFQMIAGNAVSTYRAWTATTAPPAATSGVLLVLPASVVRGQQPAYTADTYGQLPQPAPQGQVVQGQVMQGQPAQGAVMQGQVVAGQPMYPAGGEVVYGEPVYGAPPAPVAGGGRYGFLTNPFVIGGIVAAAIAIPLALDDDDDAS